MTSALTELAQTLRTKPDALRAKLRYYNIKVRGKTLKQLTKAMKDQDLIPEGVIELDGQGPPRHNGNAAAHEPEANLANRLHGIRSNRWRASMSAPVRMDLGKRIF